MSGFEKLLSKFGGMQDDPSELPPEPTRVGLESFIQKFAGVTEEYKFYGDTVTLRFDKESWTYFLVNAELGNLEPQNGVTGITKIINISDRLVPWSAKVMAAKLLRLIPTEMVEGVIRIKPLTLEEFTVIVLEAKSAHKDKLDEASDTGGLAHTCLEDSIRHAIQNDPEKKVRNLINLPADERAVNAANSAKNWMDQHNVRWLETEHKIYSREYKYAGTMDGRCLVDSCTDEACCRVPFKDRMSIADWKSSNYLSIGYLFQTAAYENAYEEEHGVDVEDRWILRLGKSEEEAGKFEPWHLTAEDFAEDFAGYLACLRLSNLVDAVEERMSKAKGQVRAIRKVQKETAKALAKEQEKLRKAIEKAAAKIIKEQEKQRIKAEAKAERELNKRIKKMGGLIGTVNPDDLPTGITPNTKEETCTSTSKTNEAHSGLLASTNQSSTDKDLSPSLTTPVPEMPPVESTTSTEETTKPVVGTTLTVLSFEEEKPKFRTFDLPMEKK